MRLAIQVKPSFRFGLKLQFLAVGMALYLAPCRVFSAPCDESGDSAPSSADAAAGAKSEIAPLAHFRFEGRGDDENAANPAFELISTRFIGGSLYLNGKYEYGGPGSDGYHALCRTPNLDYAKFSVVLRLKPQEFGPGKSNLFTGGPSYRWFGMKRSSAGNLTITLNNQQYSREIDGAKLEPGKWSLLACGVDLAGGRVVVYFNGKEAADFELPKDFKLAVLGSPAEARDKVWSFANYASGDVFHGLVDELLIYPRVLSAEEFAAIATVAPERDVAFPAQAAAADLADGTLRQNGAKPLAKGYKASWAPDGKQIVFSSLTNGAGIDRVDLESGKVTRLVAPGKDPAYSPSGNLIAYVRGDTAEEQVWLVGADGANNRKLADGGFPSWSSDGKTIYFHSRGDWMIKALDVAAPEHVVKDLLLVRESWYPAVAPDGKHVAYVAGGNVVVVNLESQVRLTRPLPGGGSGLVGWSPDSKQVGYSGYGATDGAGVWLLDLAGGTAKQVARGALAMPAWSPDGKWLAFDIRGAGMDQVWAIETSKLKALEPVKDATDRYAVPEGDAEKLLAFIQQLRRFRPTNATEMREHSTKSPAAIATAAERILATMPDESSITYATARLAVLEPRLRRLAALAADERQALMAEFEAGLKIKAAHGLEASDVVLATNAARTLEYGEDPSRAADAHRRLARLIGSESGPFAAQARTLEGSARRLDLVGHEVNLEGKTAAGEKFDWASYRGKVVLIDFWATWCGPCVAELPNVRSLYERYHDRGFEVVGISLDRDRQALDKFLADKQIAWTTLHEAGGQHPVAMYYGVSGIPTMLLVDRDGKVVSLKARGEELKRLLGELIGPIGGAADDPK